MKTQGNDSRTARRSEAGQQAYYDSREEVGKRFRKLAKPLVEQTRDLWKRIQQIEDPILRTLKETAYEMLFQPLWDASINEQFYIDYPHLRPKQDVERRKRLKELAEAHLVSLQGDDAGAKGQAKGADIVKQWDAAELETMKEKAKFFDLDKTKDFEDFKKKYLKAAETLEKPRESGIIKVANSTLPNGLPMDGKPDSIVDKTDDEGRTLQRRLYNSQGMAQVDFDTSDHNRPDVHTTGAHKHIFDYSSKKPRRGKPEKLSEEELKQNSKNNCYF